MKTTKFLVIAIIAAVSVTNNVVAQRTTEKTSEATNTISPGGKQEDFLVLANKTAGWDLRTTEVRIVATDDGCEIHTSSSSSPDNYGGGMAVGKQSGVKKLNTQMFVKLSDVLVTEPQNGNVETEQISSDGIVQGTHIKEARLSARQGSGGGSGKVNVQDFHFTVKSKGKPVNITVNENGFAMPENCPDGTYDVVFSWSWGASQSGAITQKTVKTTLKIENGVCVDHAINTKGTGGN